MNLNCTFVVVLVSRYYFSLHAPLSKEEIYSSELQSSANPTWADIEPDNLRPIHRQSLRGTDTFTSHLVVKRHRHIVSHPVTKRYKHKASDAVSRKYRHIASYPVTKRYRQSVIKS